MLLSFLCTVACALLRLRLDKYNIRETANAKIMLVVLEAVLARHFSFFRKVS